jgi:hypothetical protein
MDATRLKQILFNLINNAIKFTERGSVTVTVSRAPSLPWDQPITLGPILRFDVEDTGIGMTPDQVSRIYLPFTQVHDAQAALRISEPMRGNGLGLAISQKLAQLLGGEMGFESEPGVGSRFWLRLPLVGVKPLPPTKTTRKLEVQTAQSAWRFLVADDHPVNRLLVKQVLHSAWPRCTVLEAANGQVALDVLRIVATDGSFDTSTIDIDGPHGANYRIRTISSLDDDIFDFIVMDGNGCLYATLQGNTRTILLKFTVDLTYPRSTAAAASQQYSFPQCYSP